jgi:hypothetical protein
VTISHLSIASKSINNTSMTNGLMTVCIMDSGTEVNS